MPKKREKQSKRKTAKRILILTEGKRTEPKYFKAFKTDKDLKLTALDVPDSKKTSPYELVQEADKLKKAAENDGNKYAVVWVVFDRDKHPKLLEAFELAAKHKVNIAFSSKCFEYWFLLHFEKNEEKFKKCDDLIAILETFLEHYKKNVNCYDVLKDNRHIAIKNAQLVRNKFDKEIRKEILPFDPKFAPYTDVDKLVEELLASSNL